MIKLTEFLILYGITYLMTISYLRNQVLENYEGQNVKFHYTSVIFILLYAVPTAFMNNLLSVGIYITAKSIVTYVF